MSDLIDFACNWRQHNNEFMPMIQYDSDTDDIHIGNINQFDPIIDELLQLPTQLPTQLPRPNHSKYHQPQLPIINIKSDDVKVYYKRYGSNKIIILYANINRETHILIHANDLAKLIESPNNVNRFIKRFNILSGEIIKLNFTDFTIKSAGQLTNILTYSGVKKFLQNKRTKRNQELVDWIKLNIISIYR